MKLHDWHIRERLNWMMVASSTLILLAVILAGYFSATSILVKEMQTKSYFLARSTANHIENATNSIEKIAQTLAAAISSDVDDKDDTENRVKFARFLPELIRTHPELYGCSIVFEPDKKAPRDRLPTPHAFRARDGIRFEDLRNLPIPYFIQDAYSLPRVMQGAIWTEPYYSLDGYGELLVTYSVPVYRDNNPSLDLIATVTCDLSLVWLTNELAALPLGKGGYAFALSGNGTFISHPVKELILSENIFSRAEANRDTAMRSLGKRMIRHEDGFLPYISPITGKQVWMTFVPLSSTGWTLATMIPRNELQAQLLKLSRTQLVVAIIGFLLLWIVASLVADTITRPIRKLGATADALAEGRLDINIPEPHGKDEIAHLTRSFGIMRDRLQEFIQELKVTVAAKERFESELRIARTIQMSLVPRTFPPFPDRKDMDIFGDLEPALEVGGDFYDFFLLNDHQLCLAIGDVSGKGIPASLFMAVTRSFLRSFFQEAATPVEVMTKLNRELSRENENCMFVTMFCAVVDLRTGQMNYVNAGHNPPVILQSDGSIAWLSEVSGIALGLFEEAQYNAGIVNLQRDDLLFLYTDGVTEAMNERDEQLGEDRMEEALIRAHQKSCQSLIEMVRSDIDSFVGLTLQSDDITMLALRVHLTA